MHNERGFIALVSVIIISAILLVLTITLETSSFFQRFDAVDAENKRVSLGLAEACVNVAILNVQEGNDILSPLPAVVVDSSDSQKTCRVCKATAAGAILTRAVYNGAYTDLSVAVDSNFAVSNWQETANYTGGVSCPLP